MTIDRGRDERFRLKKQLYNAFDNLDNSDDELDQGRQASEAVLKKGTRTKSRAASSKTPDLANVSHPALETGIEGTSSTYADSRHLTMVRGGSRGQQSTTPVPRLTKSTSDVTVTTSLSKAIGKRKRAKAATFLPEEQQVFKGLHFYFFPNNDVHPARRMRISKATEFGATWEKAWSPDVTHIVLDKDMDFGILTKFLRFENIPDGVLVVPENYPAECISYRTLLDPSLPRFTVKGLQQPKNTPRPELSPAPSLQLKPAGRDVIARQLKTPSPQENLVVPNTDLSAVVTSTAPNLVADGQRRHCIRIMDSFQAPESSKELDEAIEQAKALQGVPLDNDEDEDEDSRPSSSEGLQSGDDEKREGLALLKQRQNKFKSFQDRFQCMQKHTGEQSNSPNIGTIGILQQMADYYGQIGDDWRLRAYRKAIATLRNHPVKVSTKEEALALPNIGERLAAKIEEIAFTNRLRRLDNTRTEARDQTLQTFIGIYGAGFSAAKKWVNRGFITLDELLQKADLTENQRIGIEHYADFNSRIPRDEVEQHGNTIRDALHRFDPSFEVIVGGSYRRGSCTSGDIDCIITRPETDAAQLRDIVLGQLVPQLTVQGFLVAALATTSKDDGSKWHGASCLPDSKIWRRLDLLLVPSDELGAALIYFTGNDIFNRSLRLLASTKGMRLNQRGLYKDVIRGKGRVKLTDGTLVEGKDEKRIFEILGVPWRPPAHRVC